MGAVIEADAPALVRLPDWRRRLGIYIASLAPREFAYGRNDCALFAAGAVLAMTGIDFAAPYRGRYASLAGGMRVLRKDGFADHVALAAAHLPACHPSQAMPGDLAFVSTDQGRVLGVVQGPCVYVLSPDGRVALRQITDFAGAFHV